MVFAAGWWAGRTALDPPRDPLAAPSTVMYTVQRGVVEDSFPMTVTARWPVTTTVSSPVAGVVTAVMKAAGAKVAEGDSPLTVDLQPVVLVTGSVPMFRDLALGIKGPDVAQLQRFLSRKGFYRGSVDGTYSRLTRAAVLRWQRSIGLERTGSVPASALVFVPALPVTVRPVVSVGDRIAAGDALYEVLASAPSFSALVAQDQLALLTPEVTVRIDGPDGRRWNAVAATTEKSDTDEIRVTLTGRTGKPVCGEDCDLLPVADNESRWQARALTVPQQEGPQLPVGAIKARPDTSNYVLMADGSQRDVTVLASARGLAVVNGVDEGEQVRIPQTEQ